MTDSTRSVNGKSYAPSKGGYVLAIRPIREAMGVTREDLAAALAVKPLAIYSWETHRKRPNSEQIAAAADFLGCHPGDLYARIFA